MGTDDEPDSDGTSDPAAGADTNTGSDSELDADGDGDSSCVDQDGDGVCGDTDCAGGACGGTLNDARCAGVSVPSVVAVGAPFSATVTMDNTGTRLWRLASSGVATPHRLGSQDPQDNVRWGLGRVELPSADVPPTQSASFTFVATAPASPGSYAFAWRMVEDGVAWFGDTCSASIAVTTCTNGVKDGDEGDVDCGGSCARCPDLMSCNAPADCASGSCTQARCLRARVQPSAANIDYFLGRTCYGIWAFAGEAGESVAELAELYRGCKHIRWTDFTWRNDHDFAGFTPAFFATLATFADAIHARDPDVVLEAAFAEYTCAPLYNRTGYDFAEFPALASYGYGSGNFNGAAMMHTPGMWGYDCDGVPSGESPNTLNSGVTDTSSVETLKLYTWLTAKYASAGFEAFYLPQNDLTSGSNGAAIRSVMQRIREVGAIYGRRGSVLVAGEVYASTGYNAVLVDGLGRGVVDYLKAIPEIDWVRASGPPAQPTYVAQDPPYAPACVDDTRRLWESRLPRPLGAGDLCFVDNTMGYRNGERYSPAYGKQEAPRTNAFWLPTWNPARIPVVMELDGCQPPADRGPAPWDGLIRSGITPQVRFFATRSSDTREAYIRYAPWAARSLTSREGIPVYTALPVKEDQAGHGGCVGSSYPDEAYCPGSGKASFFYQADADFCDDLGAVRAAVEWTPGDASLVFTTVAGAVTATGGGYRTNLRHQAGAFGGDPVVEVNIQEDQTAYDVLTAGGMVWRYAGSAPVAVSTGLTGARDLLAYGGARWVLMEDGGVCKLASSADGYAARIAVAGCTSPGRLAGKPGTLALLERSGRLWRGPDASTLVASDVLQTAPAAALSAGDAWIDVEVRPQDGDLVAASSFGVVVRLRASGVVELVQAKKWDYAVAVDVAHMTTAGASFLYLLDSWGGLHHVPVAADGQSASSFPDLYPWPYYGGTLQGKYVGLQGVNLR